jgi:hypothetical protein
MTNYFSVDFERDGMHYKADILKIPFANNIPVQYHVVEITPEIKGVTLPIYFIHEPAEAKFEYPFFPKAPDLCHNLMNTIKKYCIENNVSLTGN